MIAGKKSTEGGLSGNRGYGGRTDKGEQEGIASLSVEKDVQTDVTGSDIDSLYLAHLVHRILLQT